MNILTSRVIDRSEVPAPPETVVCDDHGEYEVKYNQITDDKFIRSPICDKCNEAGQAMAKADSLKQQLADQIERRQRRLINAGVSRRLINKTFNDYVVSIPGQAKAKAKCEALARSLLKDEQVGSLILSGGVGTGKTALCAAMANVLVDHKTVRITKTIDLVRDLKESWSKDCESTEKGLIKFYSTLDLLVIDEIGVQYGSDTERLFLFDIIDGRYNNMLPTVLISNLGMDAIKEAVGERIIDRLREDGGDLVAFDWDSHRKQD